MGAILVCFGVQESDSDEYRQQSIVFTPNTRSLLERLQTNWNSRDHSDDEEEDIVNWETFMSQSNKVTASSGSRMLSAFYSRLLEEKDDWAFYFDTNGKRMKGHCLNQVEIMDNYFVPLDKKRHHFLHSVDSYEISTMNDDCFSTSSTMMSEMDYWVASNPHLLTSQPVLGRCSSLGPPVNDASVKIHRAVTSPHLQDDMYYAYLHLPWSLQSSSTKLLDTSHDLSSPKLFVPATDVYELN